MENVAIAVSGMTCGGCVASVRRVLSAVPGVAEAQVSLDPPEARVRFDPAATTAQALRAAMDAAGYSVSG
ncbi:MAG: heavy-metal-associated domain-containing protein [Betaproteobacteria bacterium]